MASRTGTLHAVLLISPLLYLFTTLSNVSAKKDVLLACGASIAGYLLTSTLIPSLNHFFINGGFKGKDMGRRGTKDENVEIPSALGLVSAVVYLIFIITLQVLQASTVGQLALFNAALLSICFMVLLGFVDDAVDLPWRFKLILPPIASLPLLCSYNGVTSVVMPLFIRPLLVDGTDLTELGHLLNYFVTIDVPSHGAVVQIGIFYYIYMSLLAVFCTNAINIYAGINGLEAGQAAVIAVAVAATNLYELSLLPYDGSSVFLASATRAAGDFPSSSHFVHPHLFSATLIIPFIGVTLGLLRYNKYPASVFVGDTFCYFAGMTLAVSGILGHFSKTLLLFLIPQIFNFIYSIPQLFKVYPCPRHRLPRFNAADGLLYPSTFVHNGKEYANMTLINLVIRVVGPIREESLTLLLLVLQFAMCALGCYTRYSLGPHVFYNSK